MKFIEDYGSMILEAKKLAKEQEGTGASKTSRANASERSEQSEWNERSERVKILTPNQMIKESLLNEIRQIAYSLYRPKEITKTLYNNIIKSIKV